MWARSSRVSSFPSSNREVKGSLGREGSKGDGIAQPFHPISRWRGQQERRTVVVRSAGVDFYR